MAFLDENGVTRLTRDYLDIFALKNSLDATKLTGTIPSANLPSYVDDVLEYAGIANFPATGETGKIYVDTTNNNTYRWTGSTYANISNPLDYATQSEAETGTNDTKVMTPLRTAQEIASKTDSALSSSSNNPVRNSVIKQALDDIDNIIEKHEENTAMIESSTAQSNHAIGDLFMIGSILKVATKAIASGEQINNSNSSNTNVVEQLNAVDDKVGTINTKIGNVGSTSLQSQVSAINTKIGNVGSTSLQSQVNTISNTASNAKTKTDKLSIWDASIDFVLSDTLTIRLGAATNRVFVQLCQDGTWTTQKNIATW